MPLNNFTRPNFPYANQPLPNDSRFDVITKVEKRAVKSIEFDWEIDNVIDCINKLDLDVQGISAGIIPGANNILNAGLLPTTDGLGNISWINVTNDNILDNSLSALKLVPLSIVTDRIANGAVTPDKIPNGSIPYTKMNFDNEVIPGDKLFNKSVTQGQLALLSVGTPELIDANVTLAKMAVNSVGTTQIIDANVTLPKMAANSVGTTQLIDANVTTLKVADGAITLPKIAANVLTPAASKAQQIAAASNTVYTNPAVQQFHPSAVKFWCCFDGNSNGTFPPVSGYNVTNITKIGVGEYTVNITTPFANSIWIPGFSINVSDRLVGANMTSQTTTSLSFRVRDSSNTLYNSSNVCVFGYGLQ